MSTFKLTFFLYFLKIFKRDYLSLSSLCFHQILLQKKNSLLLAWNDLSQNPNSSNLTFVVFFHCIDSHSYFYFFPFDISKRYQRRGREQIVSCMRVLHWVVLARSDYHRTDRLGEYVLELIDVEILENLQYQQSFAIQNQYQVISTVLAIDIKKALFSLFSLFIEI